MVDLGQLLLCEAEEAEASLALGDIEVFLADPAKEPDALSKYCVSLQIVGGDGLCSHELGRESADISFASSYPKRGAAH